MKKKSDHSTLARVILTAPSALSLVFIALKVLNVIAWSWCWCFAPVIVYGFAISAAFLFMNWEK